MFESFLIAAGVFTLVLGLIIAIHGTAVVCSEWQWRATWKWGDARKIKRSVKLGWNTGEPPIGKPILIRQFLHDFPQSRQDLSDDWAVMVRRGNKVFTDSGSFMPIENVTGWLEIVE